ncbi:hypothetical protein ACFO5X_10765 [Seohaeicola nanhaiensis]|uniref:Secreted protein n=1 Tax=Seohaeicola nanhaiensis TaxID=1387282 RepID=A0ABV9KG24_9RHOB
MASVAACPALADAPVIRAVKAEHKGTSWRFDVTVTHPDTGWAHYADAWRIVDAAGNELGLRILAHPHETEQPFTRSLSGVEIPEGTTEVWVEGRCLVDGWSGERFPVRLK